MVVGQGALRCCEFFHVAVIPEVSDKHMCLCKVLNKAMSHVS